jgi:TolB-like protein/DNA-binding winged helix-turn-helix (wHTH) protein
VDLRAEFHVNDWLVEPQLNLLKRGDKSVHVEPKVMQVLLYLADRPGEVVSKKTLKKEIWEDAWVTDDALTRCVSDLRKALEDDSKNPRVIQTIPRGGYRFIASVGRSGDTVAPPIPKFHRVLNRRRLLYTSIGLLVVAALLAIRWGDLLSTPTKISSIAVLPFQNISNDPEQEYLADAMTEALISDLANIDVLQVASRTSVMRYKGTTKPISEIARELKVDALVEGSVVPAGGRVRITAQLIHGATDRHIWAGTYERDLSDVLFLQKEVARAVAQEVEITLTPADRERLSTAQTVDPIAYQAYVKGRYFASQRSEEGLKKAVEQFESAIQQAPSFALAHSGLADASNFLGYYGFTPVEEAFARSKSSALRALELDSSCAEAYASLGLATMAFDRDLAKAQHYFREAIRFNPRYAPVHHWLGLCLLGKGQVEEATSAARVALELDPLSVVANTFLAQCLSISRQYAEAVTRSRETLELYPEFSAARLVLADSYWRLGQTEESLAEVRRLRKHWADEPARLDVLHSLYSGRKAEAIRRLDVLAASSSGRSGSATFLASGYALAGDHDKALAWLHQASVARDLSLLTIHVDPAYESLRSDPRFAELLDQIALKPNPGAS